MMDNSKQQNQLRFFLAAALSMMVLFGWSYFFAPPKPPTDNTNTAQVVDTANTANTQTQPIQPPQTPTEATVSSPDMAVPGR